ncbi:hypothetical protein So717_33710 [Roseobacter cerasinus]|uniref:ATP-grasp domain-containing protein n=1 Tax=Roseobacter cerasinus TaxID=2602289 RepID=A0A640VTA4_9RHOB|nr:hypothetical protein So717_33710 [Roseobacter cerasinus]
MVNPVSNGSLLARHLIARGVACDALIEVDKVARMSGVSEARRSEFDATLYQRIYTSADEVPLSPDAGYDAVLAGSENGVGMADVLAARMGLPGNDPDTSRNRIDKGHMQRALSAAGLRAASTTRVARTDDALAAVDRVGGFPVVLKPAAAAGSQDVMLCHTEADLRRAWAAAPWGAFTTTWNDTLACVLQRYLEGPEYCVDLVAQAGQYRVAAVSRYVRCSDLGNWSRPFVKAYRIPCPVTTQAVQDLVRYAKACARALAVQEGPLHLEAILTPQGPVMLEVGARLHGTQMPLIFQQTYRHALLDQIFEASFRREDAPPDAVFILPTVQRYTLSARPGQFDGIPKPVADQLERLATLVAFVPNLPEGAAFARTEDLFTVPMQSYFVGNDLAQIWRDIAAHQHLTHALFHEDPTPDATLAEIASLHHGLIHAQDARSPQAVSL